MENQATFTAFAGTRLLASGPIETTLARTKERMDEGESKAILVFDDRTGGTVDFDFRGSAADVVERLVAHPHFAREEPAPKRSGPGRPKLGVVSREVSLLPRHWAWLERRPGGISAALRRLVDEARKASPGPERARAARDAAAKFMWTMAGDLPNFEESSRAFFAKDAAKMETLVEPWPADVKAYLYRLAKDFLEAG